jgi:hypothetical protein
MAPSKYPRRRVEVRFPSEEEKKKMEAVAEARGVPFAKYILMILMEAHNQKPRTNSAEVQHLQAENMQLRQVVGEKELLLAQREGELQRLRSAALLQQSWDADIDSNLLQALKSGPLHDHRLLEMMQATEPAAVRAVSKQLQILEVMGLVDRTNRGWTLRP